MLSYLFTLVIEVFTGILNLQTRQPGFKFFWRCKPTRLTHLFFTDNVLIFAEANMPSLALLKAGISRFSGWCSLIPNMDKSEIFFSGVSPASCNHIKDLLGFQEVPCWTGSVFGSAYHYISIWQGRPYFIGKCNYGEGTVVDATIPLLCGSLTTHQVS